MKRIRDAKTGLYISREEANKRDDSTWFEDEDFNKSAFLEEVFRLLIYKSYMTPTNNRIIDISDIEKIFSKYGKSIKTEDILD